MPAAAVIPAPIVYIKVAAVKKLVVGFRSCSSFIIMFRQGLHGLVLGVVVLVGYYLYYSPLPSW